MRRAPALAWLGVAWALGPAGAGGFLGATGVGLGWSQDAGLAAEPSCGPRPPPIPAFPDELPAPPEPPDYDPARGMGTTLDLGLGALGPVAESPGAEWIAEVEFPLFEAPGGRLAGWVANGWWIEAGSGRARPLDTAAMLETGYEAASWIALEVSPGGWLRVRLRPGTAGSDGTAWALACHLSASDPPLAFEPWERFLATGPLFFRTTNAHALRAGPGPDRALRSWIRGSDHDAMLDPLEVRGDWMKVRLTRPSTYCVFEPPPDVRVEEGWIRWRDGEMGPWVWTFTRGC